MKPASTRVDETIAFIDGYAKVPMARRNAVAKFCRDTYPQLLESDFGPYRDEFLQLSGGMSVSRNATFWSGDQANRAKRRAIFLIWKSISKFAKVGNFPDAQAAMTMPTSDLEAKLAEVIVKASACLNATLLAGVFNELVANPEQFLKTQRLTVSGSTEGAEKFSEPGLDYTNIVDFLFQYDPSRDTFVLDTLSNAKYPSHPVAAVSVPAIYWFDVPGNGGEKAPAQKKDFSGILGCELAGADFMVTSQFTGCAFCWTVKDNVVRAAHIGPARPPDMGPDEPTTYPGSGPGLAEDLTRLAQANEASMDNAEGATLRVFGRGHGNAIPIGRRNPFYPERNLRQATIIGCKAGGIWKLYLQTLTDVPLKQIGEARQIL
jgi:hypothetical protein